MGKFILEDWLKLLDYYLEKAGETIVNNDIDERNKFRNRLHLFIRSTPQKYEFIDDIARRVIEELNNYDLNMAVENIKEVTRDLKKQRALIVLSTNKAKKAAKEIRLEEWIKIFNETAEKVGKINETAGILDDKDKSFKEKVSAIKLLIDALEEDDEEE